MIMMYYEVHVIDDNFFCKKNDDNFLPLSLF